jgi:hypothetical protein
MAATKTPTAYTETIAGNVTPGTKTAIEDYRWPARQTVSDVVREAVALFLSSKGITVTEPVTDGTQTDLTGTDAPEPAPEPEPAPVTNGRGKASVKA